MSEPKAKPFPWRCPECLKEEVRPAVVSYNADVKHDGKTHAVEIPALRVPRCEACGELVFGNDTDDQITQALHDQINPGRCVRCLQLEVRPAKLLRHQVKATFEGQVHELLIHNLQIVKCGDCGNVEFTKETEDQIIAAFREQVGKEKKDHG